MNKNQTSEWTTSNVASARFIFLCISLFIASITANLAYAANPIEKNSTQSVIGHIQFVIGKEVQIKRQDQAVAAQVGASLYENDALLTGENSFIHVKMVDDALISIRPQSHLQINCYQDKAEVGESCLKFTLLKGQVRKVSGRLGKADPSKYRLNTPVAAIGIRGTDYTASVQNGTSLVKVMQGAISVSPFIENCTAQGFGECHTTLTALLTEHDSYMLRILSGQVPEAITTDLQAYSPNKAPSSDENVISKPEKNREQAGHEVEDSTQNDVADNSSENSVDNVSEQGLNPREQPKNIMSTEIPVLKDNESLVAQFIQQANLSVEERLHQEGLKDQIVTPVITPQADLVFGTWSPYADGIALSFNDARQGRDITVGDARGALWRSEGVYRPPAGQVDYNLAGSHAYVMNGDQVTSAEVTSGSMNIDFDQKVLSTQMTIEPSNMRKVVYAASHNLTRPDGIFANNTASGRVGEGAISNDGSQVGYRLQQPIEQGMLHADTLWNAIQAP